MISSERRIKVLKSLAPIVSTISLFACGTKMISEEPVRDIATTGKTAEEFAQQNNGRVAWFPGHGREQDAENAASFCEELGAKVTSVIEYRVRCLFDGVEVEINTSWNESYFDQLMGNICEQPPISGAVILVEKDRPPQGDPVFACFRPESSVDDRTS